MCRKLIKASRNTGIDEDTLVVVPFSGSGSECVAAKLEEVIFIGFEINEDYIKLSNTRIDNTVPEGKVEVTIDLKFT